MLPKYLLMLPRGIGACAWPEQVGSLRSPSQAHAPRPNTTRQTEQIHYTKPVYTLLTYRKRNRNRQPRAPRAELVVLARGFVVAFSVALSHLRYHFAAYYAHIYPFVPTVEIVKKQ